MTPTTQLPGESNRAYEAFKLYLGMGPKRSHGRVAKKLRVSATFVSRLASRFTWKTRVSAALLEDRQIEMDAKAKAALEAARELERRRAEVREDSWTLYKEALAIARKLLHQPLSNESPASAARLVAVADALGRMSVGLPVGRHELTGKDGETVAPHPISQPVVNVIIRESARTREAEKLAGDVKPPGRV